MPHIVSPVYSLGLARQALVLPKVLTFSKRPGVREEGAGVQEEAILVSLNTSPVDNVCIKKVSPLLESVVDSPAA
jgi:hypothetical protein